MVSRDAKRSAYQERVVHCEPALRFASRLTDSAACGFANWLAAGELGRG